MSLMDDQIKQLGQRLRTARINRDDPQKEFAVRIGVSIPTLHKMETGHPSISIGKWVKALTVLDRLDDLNDVLKPKESLFSRRSKTNLKGRLRVKKRLPKK